MIRQTTRSVERRRFKYHGDNALVEWADTASAWMTVTGLRDCGGALNRQSLTTAIAELWLEKNARSP
jgi:hypothetical protein